MKKLNVEEIKKELVNEEMSFMELDNFTTDNGEDEAEEAFYLKVTDVQEF